MVGKNETKVSPNISAKLFAEKREDMLAQFLDWLNKKREQEESKVLVEEKQKERKKEKLAEKKKRLIRKEKKSIIKMQLM